MKSKRPATKTDNAFFQSKVALRERFAPEGAVRVLDCFAGTGRIWSAIKANGKIDVERVDSIEKESGKNKHALEGDNLKIIPSLDLSKYNVIGMDAYGSPEKQLKASFENKTLQKGTSFFFTYITRTLGTPTNIAMKAIGVSNKMAAKCHTLFLKVYEEAFYEFIRQCGVSEVKIIKKKEGSMTKTYGYFVYK